MSLISDRTESVTALFLKLCALCDPEPDVTHFLSFGIYSRFIFNYFVNIAVGKNIMESEYPRQIMRSSIINFSEQT